MPKHKELRVIEKTVPLEELIVTIKLAPYPLNLRTTFGYEKTNIETLDGFYFLFLFSDPQGHFCGLKNISFCYQ